MASNNGDLCRIPETHEKSGEQYRLRSLCCSPLFSCVSGILQRSPLFDALERINGPQKPEDLKGEDSLRQELLKIAQCKRPFSLGEARQIIKSRAKFRRYENLSSSIKRATESLKRSKLLVESKPPQTDHYIKKTNTCWVEVAKWTSLSPEAQREVESLRISRDNFL